MTTPPSEERTPERLLDELVRQRKSNLFVIANDAAVPGKGIGKLVDAGLVTRMIASHIGLNPKAQQQMMAQKMAIDRQISFAEAVLIVCAENPDLQATYEQRRKDSNPVPSAA